MNPSRKRVAKTWIAAVLWLIVIAIESTTWLSSDETSRILYPILHFLTGVDPVRFEVWHFYIRKSGHVVGYFVCSWLLFNAWRATLRPPDVYRRWAFKWAAIAWLMTTTVASLDEWHQAYLPGRTGTWHDVVLDSAAALAAQLLILLWCRTRSKTPQRSLTSVGV